MAAPLALVHAEAPFDNGSFEMPVIEAPFVTFHAGETIGPWVVTAGQVDLVFSAVTAQHDRQSIDMSGFVGGIICQSFATTTGAPYEVSFWMSHNAVDVSSASLSARVTGITSLPFTHNAPSDNITNPRWEPHAFSFTATGNSSELCFESTDPPVDSGPAGGALLDNVTVTERSAGPGADLALAKADSPDPVRVGQALTYTLRVTNNGPAEATGVTLTDTLPARVSFGSPDPDQGICSDSGRAVRCELGALASGASTGVRIVVTPTVAGTPTTTATVSAEQHDPNENDNTAEQSTTVDPGPFGNGSFEVPMIEDVEEYRTIPAGKTIGPWVVTEGDVDIQSTWAKAQDGRQSVDMSGFVGGKICQSFTTTTGAMYEVSFWMSHNTVAVSSASLSAIVTGITSLPFTHNAPSDNKTNPRWEPHVFSFTATGDSSELCFESTDPPVGSGPDGAAMLDNVAIQPLDTAPPTVSLATPAVAGTTGDATPTFSGTAGDAPGDSATITVKIYAGSDTSGPLVQTLTTTRSGSVWSVQGSSPLAPGTYTVQAEQSDAAGNVGVSSPSTFTVTDPTGGGGGGAGGAVGGAAGAGAGASQEPPPPRVGKTFNAETVSGVITFKCGSGPQRPLEEAEQLPIGCRIDARRGKVEITSAAGNGKTQSGVFSGGLFVVRQKAGPKPVTELRLVGKLENCPASGSVSTAGPRRAKPGRRLWGKGKGAFRTRGRRSAATVTGTTWLVEDRCDGSTLTKVFRGRVKVRDFVRDITITLTQGQSYVARPRSRGRR